MTLPAGTRLGPYEILSPIGAGGMGEVYRARDSKLQREVAVKVLPETLAKDADALARFEREALSVAALSHPNILAIHDFGTQDGTAYAVMELLEGETLRERLGAGLISQKQTIDYALQIAKGLSAAHEKGVVHRDLKPENLFVTRDGHVKILDFGLAKRVDVVSPDQATSAPTRSGHTEPGTVMGTVGYMSPEQVKGLAIDHRSDIFSFGTILYEMLSGNRAFRRDTNAETMAAIMRDEPPELSESGRAIPVALDHIVKHCLEKSRESRFQSARDIAFALSEASGSTSAASGAQPSAPASGRRVAWIAASVLVVLAVAAALLPRRSHPGAGDSAGVRRIAVLPFENLGGAEDDYFADGIADAVRGKLTGMPGVQVIARGSSTPYRKTNKTPDQIAKELNVGYLLTATVRWQKAAGSSRVEVTPELVEIAGGSPTSKWQQPFEASLTDVFKVQSDIATQVAQSLGVALGAAEEKRLSEKPTENLAAYDAFLKGDEAERNFYIKEARDAYQRALALDPKFAMAMLGLARQSSDADERLALIRRAELEKEHLTERERLLVEFALAGAEHRPEDRVKAAQQLHAKYPDDVQSAHFLSGAERATGNPDAAIRIYEDLLVVDPRNAEAYNQIAYIDGYRGDYENAIANLTKYQSLVGVDKANPYDSFGEIQANSGHYREAIDNLNRAIAIKPDFPFAYDHLGIAYEGWGDTARAVQSYDRAAELATSDDARVNSVFGSVVAAWNAGDLVTMRGALDRIARIPVPREDAEITSAYVAILRDLADGHPADAERRLKDLRPKLDARWEEDHRRGTVPVTFKPYQPAWNYVMARALEAQGRTDEALKLYEINADPPNPSLSFDARRWTLEARAKVAEIVARKGDLARAEKLLAENRKWTPSWAPNRPSELVVEQMSRAKTQPGAAGSADSKTRR